MMSVSSAEQLEAFAQRCEQATADEARQLIIDAHGIVFVHPLMGGPKDTPEAVMRRVEFGNFVNCSKPALADAALTLVPEGYIWAVTNIDPDTGMVTRSASMVAHNADADADPCVAATPALAITAAALRARAASAIETRRAATAKTGAVEDESATRQGDAQGEAA